MAKPCWTCGTCTLLNPATKRRCQVCNSRKPVPKVEKSHQVVNAIKIVATDSSNDTFDSTPRFEQSSTATIAIVVTTLCGTNSGNGKETLADGLIATVDEITENYMDNEIKTKIKKAVTKNRKGEQLSRPRQQRKRRSSPSLHFRSCAENYPSANDCSEIGKGSGVEVAERNEGCTPKLNSDGACATNSVTRNTTISEEIEKNIAVLQLENAANCVNRSGDIRSIGKINNINNLFNDKNQEEMLKPLREPPLEAGRTKEKDGTQVEVNDCFDAREEEEASCISATTDASFLVKEAIPHTLGIEETERIELSMQGKKESPIENQEPIITEPESPSINLNIRIDDNPGVTNFKNERLIVNDDTESIRRTAITVAATTATAIAADAKNVLERVHIATLQSKASFIRPFDAACADSVIGSVPTVNADPRTTPSTTAATGMPMNDSTADSKFKQSEPVQDIPPFAMKEQSEVEIACACSSDNFSARNNDEDSSTQHFKCESQLSFLADASSTFAYTPPKVGAELQSSRNASPGDSENGENPVTTASVQTSFPCEQSHECQDMQEYECISTSNTELPSLSSYPSRHDELECRVSTVVTTDLNTAVASNSSECVTSSPIGSANTTTATFVTAGSNSMITVSKENLERVSKLFEQPKSSALTMSTTKPSVAFFQTAGTGSSIAVSNAKVEEMGRMLNPDSKSNKEPPSSRIPRAVMKPSIAMFQSSGSVSSGTTLEEKFEEMGRKRNKSSTFSNEIPFSRQQMSIIKSPTATFQTAGSGNSITVSKEKIEQVDRMLNKTSSSSQERLLKKPRLATKKTKPSFQTSGSGTSIAVSKEEIEQVDRILNKPSSSSQERPLKKSRLSTKTAMPSFQTAGSGTSITVSKEKIEQMGWILNKPSSAVQERPQTKPRLSTKTAMPSFQTAGSGTSIAVSKEEIEQMDWKLNKPSSAVQERPLTQPRLSTKTAMASFRTAGRGTSIAVSREKVEEMGRMLEKVSSSSKDSVTSLKRQKSTKEASATMFQTAGSGISISVSQEKIEEMGRMLQKTSSSSKESVTFLKRQNSTEQASAAMFQTAGSGTSISVSQEKVEEMGRMLEKSFYSSEESLKLNCPSSSSEGAISRKSLTKDFAFSVTPSTSFQTPREDIETKNDSAPGNQSKPPLNYELRNLSSSASIAVPEKMDGARGPLNKTVPRTNSDCVTTRREAILSARTPMALLQTPRLVTAMKNSCTTSSATFRTAGSGKTIEVPEEKVEEMGLFLKDSSFSEQSTNRLSQKVAKVTVLADKDPRQKSLMDPDQHFFESNLRSYPHSPLRNKEVKLPKHKCDTAETKATPYHQLVSGSDFPRIAHRTSPSCVSKNEIVPSYSMNEGMIQLDSLSEDQGRSGDEVEDATLPRQDVHCSPNDCKILSRSANITGSSRNDLVQTRQKIDMTPIPISLNDKMDGLDASVTKRRETKPRESSSVSSDCQTLKHAIHFGEMSNCPSMCRLHGIREATMLVNCSNSLQLRFDNDGLPHSFEMDGGEQSSKLIGDVADIRLSLIDKGCDSKCIKDEWIRNHTRWIVWKLASYERRFSKFLAGRYLTYHSLVQNLLSRFKREVVNGVRPAVRKILNRDISASKMMILVVCQVISPTEAESDGTPAQSAALELSDGWYSVRGSLDSKLSQYVNDGLIAVGTKLLVSNARLVGAEDGVDPLDEGDGTGCRNYKATLQISANSTRLATWNAKLGFVNILNRRRMPHGHLLVKRISDVVPGGGNIPAIRLFIQRVYPVLYYEKRNHSDPCLQSSMSTMKRRVFTEQEEDSRRRAFEMRKLRVVEKLTDKIQGEVEQEVDESAPEIWKRMMCSEAPEETYQSFSNDDKCIVNSWKEKRNSLISRRVREEVESELEIETSLTRESTNFIRVKVHSVDPKDLCNESAMLTIWQPTEEQLSFLKEGTSAEIHNLAVRESTYDGISQLVANNRTIIEPFAFDASLLAEKIGFRQRQFLNLFQVHALSHGASNEKGRTKKNFDVAAVQIHVQTSKEDFIFYLSDETNLILRVHCRSPPSMLKALLSAEKQSFPSYALRDLFILPFDQNEQCAVAEFCDMSSVVLTNHRLESLSKWVASSSKTEIQQVAVYIRAGLPLWEHDCNEKIYLGYVMGLRSDGFEKLYIEVDCCGQGSFQWKLPVEILQRMISEISPGDTPQESRFADAKYRASKVCSLSSIFRARGLLWRFQLLTDPEAVVCSATKVNKHNIGHLYNTLQH